MRFVGSRGSGHVLGLREAFLAGYPADGGFFIPVDDADLRPAVYGPDLGFADLAALAVSALLPAEADPRLAAALAGAFDLPAADAPRLFPFHDDILVIDLAGAPGLTASWYCAAFAAALLAWAVRGETGKGPGVEAVAAASGRDAAGLAEAFGRPGIPLCLFVPQGFPLREIRPSLLARAGGSVRLFQMEGDMDGAIALERALSGMECRGRRLVPVGAGSPGRLLGRVILLVALFSLARRGASGELLVAARPGDRFGLLSGLWAWRWGLPVTAYISARLPPVSSALSTPGDAAEELLAEFFRSTPLRSLVLEETPSLDEALLAARELAAAGGPLLDQDSAFALAAAERALVSGLRGQARLVVPRFSQASWDPLPGGEGEKGVPKNDACSQDAAGTRAPDAIIGVEEEAFLELLSSLPC